MIVMTASLGERTFVVILAGGVGKRFAPYSTPERPKQFLAVTHPERTMIQETFVRSRLIAPPERCFVSTNEGLVALAQGQLPEIPRENVIGEPLMKNTAPAVTYLAALIKNRDPKAVMVVLPSDHFIEKPGIWAEKMDEAIALADEEKMLITLGIVPDSPLSQYGYIKRSKDSVGNAFIVERFIEKPEEETARGYLKEGRYYWNSGMFVWRVDVFFDLLNLCSPELAVPARDLTVKNSREFFEKAESLSIDYALMEKTNEILVLPLKVGWSDVGGWDAVSKLIEEGLIEPPKEVLGFLKDRR